MKLYFSPGSCSLSPHIVLHESGIPHELIRVRLGSHQLPDGADFYTVNALGYVPVLELADGRRLTEGVAIIQYIADQVPEKNLAPANGTWERYQLQSLLNFISTEIHKSFGPLFNPATTPAERDKAIEKLQNRFQYVDERLNRQSFLTGEQFTIADAYLFTVLTWAPAVKLDLAPFQRLADFKARVESRHSVQHALRAEGLLK